MPTPSSCSSSSASSSAHPRKMIRKPKTAGRTFALFVVSVAMFSDVFIYGLVVPVMPFALRERIGVPVAQIQSWNSMLLGVLGSATTVGSLLAGVLSDKYQTRRVPFFAGLLSLFASTVLFAAARSLGVLMVARVFQGLSTAEVCTVGYALLADKYEASSHSSETKGFGAAMGWVSSALSLGWFVGPVVGGLIYDRVGYAGVFAPALACVGVEIVLLLRLFAGEREEKERKEQSMRARGVRVVKSDSTSSPAPSNQTKLSPSATARNMPVLPLPVPPLGAAAVAAPLESTPLLGKPRSTTASPSSPTTTATTTATTTTTTKRSAHRSALVVLLSSPQLVASILALTICDGLLTSFDAVLPVYLNETYALSSEQISVVFIALVFPLCSGPLCGGLAERLPDGMRRMTCSGFVLSGLAFLGMGLLDGRNHTGPSGWHVPARVDGRRASPQLATDIPPTLFYLVPLLVFTGCSFALALTPLTTCISHLIGQIEQRSPGVFGDHGANATAYGLAHVGLGIGLVVGPMGSGYLKERFGWTLMCYVWAAVCVLGLGLAVFGVSGGGASGSSDSARHVEEAGGERGLERYT